jgi:hypothetical protein
MNLLRIQIKLRSEILFDTARNNSMFECRISSDMLTENEIHLSIYLRRKQNL